PNARHPSLHLPRRDGRQLVEPLVDLGPSAPDPGPRNPSTRGDDRSADLSTEVTGDDWSNPPPALRKAPGGLRSGRSRDASARSRDELGARGVNGLRLTGFQVMARRSSSRLWSASLTSTKETPSLPSLVH